MTKRARGGEFPEPDDPPESDLDWDEVVDVICVGTDPGPTAQAISGAQCGRRVLAVARPQTVDTDTAAYVAEMTADLASPEPGPQFPLTRARPTEVEPARGRVIDTFVGAHLRDWAGQCWATPFGVLYTDAFGIDTAAMRTDEGLHIEAAVVGEYPSGAQRSGRAVADWLVAQALEHDVQPDPDLTLQRLIIEYGRVAGAELLTASGTLLVRALNGVALPSGDGDTASSDACWALHADPGDGNIEVAIIGRPAGRFGRVELLTSG
ncbi:MAG: hypothetical protein ACOYO2_13940 [Mycobacterium sp.]